MNLMIRITRSFLTLISFAMSVISEALITSLYVCKGVSLPPPPLKKKLLVKMFRFYLNRLNILLLSQDRETRATLDICSNAM